jgi:hypothetical protein
MSVKLISVVLSFAAGFLDKAASVTAFSKPPANTDYRQ